MYFIKFFFINLFLAKQLKKLELKNDQFYEFSDDLKSYYTMTYLFIIMELDIFYLNMLQLCIILNNRKYNRNIHYIDYMGKYRQRCLSFFIIGVPFLLYVFLYVGWKVLFTLMLIRFIIDFLIDYKLYEFSIFKVCFKFVSIYIDQRNSLMQNVYLLKNEI